MAGDEIAFICDKCGGDLNTPNTLTDSNRVTCKSCGADNGSWGELNRAANQTLKESAEKELTDTLRKAIKGSKVSEIK